VHTLDDSLDTVRLTPTFGDPCATWRTRNDAGVSLAVDGRWPEALDAFSDALTAAPCFADAPDVHALLHGNRAQAHFHCGELQQAVASARRALAARLLCGDEDDAPVARSRADLGVYLAACGDVDNATQRLHEARRSLEARFGEDDLRLASVLENLARLQLLTQRPEAAEPLLLRLHALLGEHDRTTASLTPLFEAIRHARMAVPSYEAPAAAVVPNEETLDTHHFDVFPVDASSDVVDALGETSDASSLLDDAFELIDAEDYPPLRTPSPDAIRSAGLIEPGAHATSQEAMKRTHPLGFEIQYGIPQDQRLDGNAA